VRNILFFILLGSFSVNSYSFTFSEKKFRCVDKNHPQQIFSLILKTKEMSLNVIGASIELEMIECKTTKHELLFRSKTIGCKNLDEPYYTFNHISNVLMIPKIHETGVFKLECIKTN